MSGAWRTLPSPQRDSWIMIQDEGVDNCIVAGPSGRDARSGFQGGFAIDSWSYPSIEYPSALTWSFSHLSMMRGSLVVKTGSSGAPTGPAKGGHILLRPGLALLFLGGLPRRGGLALCLRGELTRSWSDASERGRDEYLLLPAVAMTDVVFNFFDGVGVRTSAWVVDDVLDVAAALTNADNWCSEWDGILELDDTEWIILNSDNKATIRSIISFVCFVMGGPSALS